MAESRSPFASTDDPSNAATGESGGAGAVGEYRPVLGGN